MDTDDVNRNMGLIEFIKYTVKELKAYFRHQCSVCHIVIPEDTGYVHAASFNRLCDDCFGKGMM